VFEIKYTKKGKLIKSEKDGLLIVDAKGKAFKVDDLIAIVWTLSNGKTIDEIVELILKKAEAPKDSVKKAVSEILEKLQEANLVEKKGK